MLYGARIRETGEILEASNFKTIYRASLNHAKSEIYHPFGGVPVDSVMIELFSFLDVRYVYTPGEKYPLCRYGGEEHIGYIAVSGAGYVVDTDSGTLEVYKEGRC